MSETTIIGRAETVAFPELGFMEVPARIDTGAKTSSIWATGIREKNGELEFRLFGKASPLYVNTKIRTREFELRSVSSSTGHVQKRYVVKLLVVLGGKRIRTSFTLANRSRQVYPILIGRRVLSGKFLVDVKRGETLQREELARSKTIQKAID